MFTMKCNQTLIICVAAMLILVFIIIQVFIIIYSCDEGGSFSGAAASITWFSIRPGLPPF